MSIALFVAVVVFTSVFAFLNGFRDASSAVGLTVRTRALTPSVAVVLAAFFNVVGTVTSAWLLNYFGGSWLTAPHGPRSLVVLLATVVGASLWNVYLWWRGYPSSSTHALVGGLVGASLAAVIRGHALEDGLANLLWFQVWLPLLISPVLAFGVAFFLTSFTTWIARYRQPSQAHATLRAAQSVGTAAVAFGHGLQDGQRIIAVLVVAAVGNQTDWTAVPGWIVAVAALALGIGTLAGGWRVTYTLSHRLIRTDPLRGFVSQLVTTLMLFFGALWLKWPLSTTHTVAASILGAGSNQRYSAVNGRLLARLVIVWIATPLVTALLGLVLALAFDPLAS
ncbi:inorganic phosphate transporter [Sinomonas humi]|uniref:Phosphate transporter n=1 Tax=Sinomonas humi TaxID=1338436 RepID=A0A0B2AIC0_9MICC|nr:inorganic phosphate transporter [Sinomonas humi]KHL03013.1 phosphate transporter [Sinomonas humi]